MARKSSSLIDRQLVRYREMRDFATTAEPSGDDSPSASRAGASESRKTALPFVIQKHAATRLHYDFRLGLHGVLKSWAVTKGPSYVPADKRLAVQVEDHPMEYGGFEGTIPKGQYGGGTVMLWDEGTWEPQGDPDEGLRKGNLKFILHGKKLRGKWVLIRMGGRAAGESKPNWLLIKEHDEFERTPQDPAITDEAPNSIATKRDLEGIARDQDHVWQSNRPETQSSAASPVKGRGATPSRIAKISVPGKAEDLPDFIAPQLASAALNAPDGPEWVHELKLDGYRIQAHVVRKKSAAAEVRLYTRKGLDWTHRMRALAAELSSLGAEAAILDGEVVVLTESGKTSFAALQAAFDENKPSPLTYFAFDLLHLNGRNVRPLPLLERKTLLGTVLDTLPADGSIRRSDHVEDHGEQTFREACRLGAEGIVSKRGSSPYSSGRSSAWLKIKCIRRQEFVIGGFTVPSNGSHGIGALLLGYYEDGRLVYAGRTGTGFTQSSSRKLRDRLEALRQSKAPFSSVPAEAQRGALWTEPKLVAEVQFSTWTADRLIRQASFKGIREDKPPEEVVRELPEAEPAEAEHAEAGSAEMRSGTAQSKGAKIGEGKAPTKKPRGSKSPRGESPGDDPSKSKSSKTGSSPKASRNIKPDSAAEASRGTQETERPNIRVTHPDKVIDPETKLTKQSLIDYYLAVADHILPHVAGRPTALVRCPGGVAQHCFFQKHWEQGLPAGVEGIEVPDKNGGEPDNYVTFSTAEALAGLAQMNVLEIHPWGSTNANLEHPDRLIFDLDPDEAVSWQTLADAAREVQERLKQLSLKCFLKSTGGKGLHVVAPIAPDYDWSLVKALAQAFAMEMESNNPKLYISKMTKAARKNKIFVDYMRNERGSTAIAPFSSRARAGVTAAVPLRWSELKSPERPRFPIHDFADWKSRLRRDPWEEITGLEQHLPAHVLDVFKR